MTHVTTTNLSAQDYFTTTLSGAVAAADTVINLTSVPSASEGFLVIDPNNATTREIIYYNSKTSSTVTCPDATQGSSRGVGGTTVQTHATGTLVEMREVAEYWLALQNWNSMSRSGLANSITADSTSHLALNAGTSKLVKTTAVRHDDTTDTYKVGTSVTIYGWGYIAGNNGAFVDKTINFPVTFSQAPVVVVTAAGTAANTSYPPSSAAGTSIVILKTIGTTSFDIRYCKFAISGIDAGTTLASGNNYFFTWTATGEI